MTRHAVVALIACAALIIGPGCATIIRGTHQNVLLRTVPDGRAVYYQGARTEDGEEIHIEKRLEIAEIDVGTPDTPRYRHLRYDPDPLLIADAVLLVFFVVPGLIAIGVDVATGAWRDYHEVQEIRVPDPES